MNTGIQELIRILDTSREVIVQTHDFPDHDAVAAAFALIELLQHYGVHAAACYGGRLESASLRDAVKVLNIQIEPCRRTNARNDAQTIVVDGFFGNTNIAGVSGEVVAIIDHHSPPSVPKYKYVDIREEYGSCSTILFEYYQKSKANMSTSVATALLLGLMMDTAYMTRGITEHDLDAFSALCRVGEWQLSARLLKNSLSVGDLQAFYKAISSCKIVDDFAFIALDTEYSVEVLALVADFFLSVRTVHFVVVVALSSQEYRLSIRSEDPQRPCDRIISMVLAGIGAGGGHFSMGGGIIAKASYPGDEELYNRFMETFRELAAPS